MSNSIFINKWKGEMLGLITQRYADVSKTKIDAYLDKIVDSNLKNKNAALVNNYVGVIQNTDLLSLVDTIYKNKLVIGGDGVLYLPHSKKDNPLIRFIIDTKNERSITKKLRSKFDKFSKEWFIYEYEQNRLKLVINILYGLLGFYKFNLFNVFLAKSVTDFGQVIICTAVCTFENFLADNVQFCNDNELFDYMLKINNEYTANYRDQDFSRISEISVEEVVKRLRDKSGFVWSLKTEEAVTDIVRNSSLDVRKLLYYKNNIYEFTRIPFVKTMFKELLDTIGILQVPDLERIESKQTKQLMKDILLLYQTFVLYKYPIYDHIRKSKYTDKKVVLYVDTDSNFLALNRFIDFLGKEVMGRKFNRAEVSDSIISIATLIATDAVRECLWEMCKGKNITEEYFKMLKMKNELYFSRILFSNVKKRYLGLALLQEGVILNKGKGLPEYKGFDFIKAGTKETIREKYKEICLDMILSPDEVNAEEVLIEFLRFKKEIVEALKLGDTRYYKQANCRYVEDYKKPLSIQGVKGTLIWNTLFPQFEIQLPADVNIVPIKLDDKKFYAKFIDKYPDLGTKLQELYNKHYSVTVDEKTGRKRISELSMNVIARPKKIDVDLPEWFYEMVDTDKIVQDAASLFNPIMASLGYELMASDSKTSHVTNIVSL